MRETELREIWKKEEQIAHIKGWDFSHIDGKYDEEKDLPCLLYTSDAADDLRLV